MIWRETPAFLHFLDFIPEDTWIAMDVGTGAACPKAMTIQGNQQLPSWFILP